MIHALDRIIEDVRVCLDETRTSGALQGVSDTETLTLDELIRSKVLEGVDAVHLKVPYWMLEQGHLFGDGIFWQDMESGYVLLPDDFLRLVVFEMSDWERPVYTAISTDNPLYAIQRSRIKAIRGTAQRPVCAIGVANAGKTLEFYSCKSEDATIKRSLYIPYAKIDRDGGVDISERCYTVAVKEIARLVLLTMGETEKAAAITDKWGGTEEV